MDYGKLLQIILDIAEEMLVAGAEVSRVEDSIERMCAAYGCDEERTNAFIITSNIQVTIEAPNGEIITQIRRVVRSDINYDRLDYLNDLSRKICRERCGIEEISAEYERVMERPVYSFGILSLGQLLAAGGFTIFFGGALSDGFAAAAVAMLMVLLGRLISGVDNNQLARTFLLSISASFASIALSLVFPGLNMDKLMIGCIMLLIPGIAMTNAVRDLLIGDLATGLLRLFNSVLIALVIACGFALPLLLFGVDFMQLHSASAGSVYASAAIKNLVSLVSAFAGSLGFALWFNMKGRQLISASVAGAFTWGVYLLCSQFFSAENVFSPNLIAALFVGVLAEYLARFNKAPATIFLTAAAVPLIPGGMLYYSMAALIAEDSEQFLYYGINCLMIALAISLGFVCVAIAYKYVNAAKRLKKA